MITSTQKTMLLNVASKPMSITAAFDADRYFRQLRDAEDLREAGYVTMVSCDPDPRNIARDRIITITDDGKRLASAIAKRARR